MNNPHKKYPFLLKSLVFALLAGPVGATEDTVQESVDLGPLEIAAFEKKYGTIGVEEEGPVVNLEPMVVSPMVTSTEQLLEDFKKDRTQFLTGKGWRNNTAYRSDVDEFLNLFSIPLFGINQEAIAYMYGLDAKLEKKVETIDLIIKADEKQSKRVKKIYLQDRYDLMRMKQNALFGSTWAVPEFGK